MLFEVRVSSHKREHMVSLQMCLVMFACGQEGMKLHICYGARAAVIWYSLWAVLFAAQIKGHV